MHPQRRRLPLAARLLGPLAAALALLCGPLPTAQAQARLTAVADAPGPEWAELSAGERRALAPLEREWSTIDAPRKEKWREIASRFDRMSAEERARVQQRMASWLRMSPHQRNEARQNYQGVRELSRRERQERWEAYKALPEEQRRGLAERARSEGDTKALAPARPGERGSVKVNTVPNTLLESRRPRAVAPSMVQARPGATTTPMSARPAPPLHQQTGLPKVAATPEFVDATTLLPQRGPQGAATEPRPKRKK